MTAVLLDKAVVRAEGHQGESEEGVLRKLQRSLAGTVVTKHQHYRAKAVPGWGSRGGPLRSILEEMESADFKYHTERYEEG